MAEVKNLTVVLRMGKGSDKKELPYIAGLTPQQNLDHYSLSNPKLATATIDEPVQEGDTLVYPVIETLGTKG